MKYLDPLSIAKLKGLHLSPRRLFSTSADSGSRKSPHRGFSRDFLQHRPYVPGDEIKALDWKAYARLDRFYVREFEAESQFITHLILDSSKSMAFGSGKQNSKWDYACHLSLALSYLAIAQGDTVGLISISQKMDNEIPPRAAFAHLEFIDSFLSNMTPTGESFANTALSLAATRIKKRSLVIFITDLMGNVENFIKGISALKSGHNAVVVFQVLDPQERDLNFSPPSIFKDMETGDEIAINNQDFRFFYKEEFDKQIRLYQSAFHQNEIAHHLFFTDSPLEESLGHFLEKIR